MNDSFLQRQQQVTDRYLQSSFGLWCALLTVNGILLAAITSVQSKTNDLNSDIILIVTGACVISLILLVYNFLATKLIYYRIGEVMADEEAELTVEQREKDILIALSRRKFIIISERSCLFLLVFEAIMVLLLIMNSIGYTGAA